MKGVRLHAAVLAPLRDHIAAWLSGPACSSRRAASASDEFGSAQTWSASPRWWRTPWALPGSSEAEAARLLLQAGPESQAA